MNAIANTQNNIWMVRCGGCNVDWWIVSKFSFRIYHCCLSNYRPEWRHKIALLLNNTILHVVVISLPAENWQLLQRTHSICWKIQLFFVTQLLANYPIFSSRCAREERFFSIRRPLSRWYHFFFFTRSPLQKVFFFSFWRAEWNWMISVFGETLKLEPLGQFSVESCVLRAIKYMDLLNWFGAQTEDLIELHSINNTLIGNTATMIDMNANSFSTAHIHFIHFPI